MSQKKLATVLAWQLAHEKLQAARAEEAELRQAAVSACFAELKDGLNRFELPGGYTFKVTHYPAYKLDAGQVPAAIERFHATGEVGALIVKRLLKTRYEISVSEYKKLEDDLKVLIDPALTISPTSPKLELVAPA